MRLPSATVHVRINQSSVLLALLAWKNRQLQNRATKRQLPTRKSIVADAINKVATCTKTMTRHSGDCYRIIVLNQCFGERGAPS
jgi:hypothetical protein